MSDRELRKKRTGKPTGMAHAYRVNKPSKRTHQTSNGEYRRKWMGYLNEWVQEDGTSKFYITDETWENWYPWYPRTGSTMVGMNELLSVQEFDSLSAAQAAWDGVADPITQGVATEEVQKPLERVGPCRWCKGHPMGLLMLEGYVPCLECGPKVVTTVHDEVRMETPTPGVEIRELMLKLFQRDVQAQELGLEGVVLKAPDPHPLDGLTQRSGKEKTRKFLNEAYQRLKDTVRQKPGDFGTLESIQEAAKSVCKEKYVKEGDTQDDDTWMYKRAMRLMRERGMSLDEERVRDIVMQAKRKVALKSWSSTKSEESDEEE